jgi:hypothetical protein
MSVVIYHLTTQSVLEILHNKRQQSDVVQSLSVSSTRGRREKLSPDTLKSVGVNVQFVVVPVDESFTTEQAASGSLGTHRVIRSNSNTDSTSSILSVNSGDVSLIVLKGGSSIAPIHRILRTLSSICSIHLSSRSRKIATRTGPLIVSLG